MRINGPSSAVIPTSIPGLRQRLCDLERRPAADRPPLVTGWAPIDALFDTGGLTPAALHEWLGLDAPTAASSPTRETWTPPLSILAHLVSRSHAPCVCWVGRQVWPAPWALTPQTLGCSIFVDPPDVGSRVWAIEAALRTPGVLVVADASGLDMPATRRLQLAAESHANIALLARPPGELKALSSAATRWHVVREPADAHPAWRIRLLRCKGQRSTLAHCQSLVIRREEHDGSTRLVALLPELRQRCDPPALAG